MAKFHKGVAESHKRKSWIERPNNLGGVVQN